MTIRWSGRVCFFDPSECLVLGAASTIDHAHVVKPGMELSARSHFGLHAFDECRFRGVLPDQRFPCFANLGIQQLPIILLRLVPEFSKNPPVKVRVETDPILLL